MLYAFRLSFPNQSVSTRPVIPIVSIPWAKVARVASDAGVPDLVGVLR